MKFGIVVNTAIASALLALFAIIVTDALSTYLPNMLSGMIAFFIAIFGKVDMSQFISMAVPSHV